MPTHSAAVLRRLGGGVGIMTAAVSRMHTEDWDGLAKRVGHIRLCGSVVEPLIDWSQCPGATRQFDSNTQAVHLLRRSAHFVRFKAAASAARQAAGRAAHRAKPDAAAAHAGVSAAAATFLALSG